MVSSPYQVKDLLYDRGEFPSSSTRHLPKRKPSAKRHPRQFSTLVRTHPSPTSHQPPANPPLINPCPSTLRYTDADCANFSRHQTAHCCTLSQVHVIYEAETLIRHQPHPDAHTKRTCNSYPKASYIQDTYSRNLTVEYSPGNCQSMHCITTDKQRCIEPHRIAPHVCYVHLYCV